MTGRGQCDEHRASGLGAVFLPHKCCLVHFFRYERTGGVKEYPLKDQINRGYLTKFLEYSSPGTNRLVTRPKKVSKFLLYTYLNSVGELLVIILVYGCFYQIDGTISK